MDKKQFSITLINQIREYIINENFDIISKTVLLAFSGGQDSICLLFILLQLNCQFNMKLNLLYCNHIWTISNLYQALHLIKISFHFKKVFFFSVDTRPNFKETNSRAWRYLNICRVSDFYNYDIVFTSHTLTDRVETLLLNLFRGSSVEGLVALKPAPVYKK